MTIFLDYSGSLFSLFNYHLWTYNHKEITVLNLFYFCFLLYGAVKLSAFSSAWLNNVATSRLTSQKSQIYRLARLIHYCVLFFVILFFALPVLGFDLSHLVVIAGALGVGLGFGLQTIFNNFFSGLLLLFESQIRIGDYVELNEEISGEIREINFRTTTLLSDEGKTILVPNTLLINEKVTIHSKHPNAISSNNKE